MSNYAVLPLEEIREIHLRCKKPNCSGVIELPLETATIIGIIRSADRRLSTCPVCGEPLFTDDNLDGLFVLSALANGIHGAQRLMPKSALFCPLPGHPKYSPNEPKPLPVA